VTKKHQSKTSYKHWDDAQLPIMELIYSCEEFVVFLDDRLAIDWRTNDDVYKDFPDGWPGVLNSAAELEDSLSEGASKSSIKRAHRLVAEGIARALDCNLPEAHASFENAERYISARNRELALIAYLHSAGWMTLVICLGALTCWLARGRLQPFLGPTLFWMILYAAGGAVGAFLSILLKRGQALDPTTESKGHSTEARARILTGVFGAVLTSLAVRSGFLYPDLASKPSLLLGICAFAGLSERLVPELTKRVETKAAAALSDRGSGDEPQKPAVFAKTPTPRQAPEKVSEAT
jgi:hypothetical protein